MKLIDRGPEAKGGRNESDRNPKQDQYSDANPGSNFSDLDKLVSLLPGDSAPRQDFFILLSYGFWGYRPLPYSSHTVKMLSFSNSFDVLKQLHFSISTLQCNFKRCDRSGSDLGAAQSR